VADHRTKAQKLRDLIAHPRTSTTERQAARLALERLGERPEAPKPPPRYQPPRGTSPFANQTFADWFEQMLRTQPRHHVENDEYIQKVKDRLRDELRRQAAQAEADLARMAEERRRAKAAIPPCPGCGHAEADHVMWRCYACNLSHVHAEWCGWAWLVKDRHPSWTKVETSWQTGPYGYADDGR